MGINPCLYKLFSEDPSGKCSRVLFMPLRCHPTTLKTPPVLLESLFDLNIEESSAEHYLARELPYLCCFKPDPSME